MLRGSPNDTQMLLGDSRLGQSEDCFRIFQFAKSWECGDAENMNIAQDILRNDPASVAFVTTDPSQSEMTYGGLSKAIDAIVGELRLHEFSLSNRIALITPRGRIGLIAFLAVSSFAICCPVDPRLLEDELAGVLRDLDVSAVVDATGERHIAAIASELALPLLKLSPSMLSIAGVSRIDGAVAREGDVALLLQTSGTTSKPKHVALTHANILAAARSIGQSYAIGPSDRCINPMPHHHVHGLISAGISSLLAGASQFCAPSFAASAFDDALSRLNATWFTGSPAFHLGLLDFYKVSGRTPNNAALRFMRSSSAPFPSSAIAQYEELFGIPLLENYGMTESASTICSNLLPPGPRKAGSVGRPIGSEVRIVDSAGAEVEVGNEGEVILRGPSIITKYASGEAGADHFMDGWLRTGDVGSVDEDGCLFILGRTKELIKRGGHSVYPLEIDSAIQSHPDVAEAISFSLAHATLGEELVAAFVPRSGSQLSGEELRGYLEGKLSTYKIPTEILRVADIPKSATGKTARRSMRSAFAESFALQGDAATSELEHKILEAWKECTENPNIGVNDNVFVHGADPLRAQRVCAQIQSTTGVTLPLKDVIRNPTVRQQAFLVAGLQQKS